MSKRSDTQFQQIWMQKMCKVCLAFLVILILFSDSSEARRLDCTVTVFHPRCRGVSAKRSESEDFVIDPRSSINEAGGADHFISNGADDDFMEFSDEDFGRNKKQSAQPSSYDIGLANKIWPRIQRALLARSNREVGSDLETFSPQKRSSNEAKLERWSKALRHLLDQQE